jgi:6-phosphogluconolactonase (cycloisomerase 2 family)
MRGRLLIACAATAWMLAGDRWEPPITADSLPSELSGVPLSSEICLMPSQRAAHQTRGGGAGRDSGAIRNKSDWPPGGVQGGDVMPARTVFDPYPTFDAVAVDAKVGRAFLTDSSLSSLLSYATSLGGSGKDITDSDTRIMGPDTGIGFIAGMDVDPERKEVYAVNNDGGGVVVFGYDQDGAVRPVRQLETPHQSWDTSISIPRNEVAVSVQQLGGIVIYRRGAADMEPPLRSIRGYATGLADPHGIDFDEDRKELVVANHGNWTELRPYSPYDPLSKDPPSYQPGRFEPPSIRIFAASATGNAKPLRSIVGAKTGMNWPMGIEVDPSRDEIIVANYGDNSVRFFRRGAEGDVEPVRILTGDRTHIVGPVDVTVDPVRDELWVANYADHTALVFDRGASGNTAPKRIIRNAPQGAPSLAFTNASAAAYDTKRDALIVPN